MDKDLLVIGGGINGVGTAVDAAGRGLSTVLCESNDLSSGTSSNSSKMIHGGLRYLAYGELGLVYESLRERRILSRLAPHLIKPQSFVMPSCDWSTPFWLLRAGLFIYDHLAHDTNMPASKILNLQELASLELKPQCKKALEYYDCITDDSRLVIDLAVLAKQHGAEILSRAKLVKALRKDSGWIVTLLHKQDLKVFNVKAIVNASGPWIEQVNTDILDIPSKVGLRLVKGSHIIVRRIFKHKHALILQNKDGRVVFIMPYQDNFTLIGTTDILLDSLEEHPAISTEEIKYLCDVTNQFLQHEITEKEIIHQYSGIRALHGSESTPAKKMSRDYVLDINDSNGNTPVICIYGGKITTYRHLAEKVVDNLKKYFPNLGKPWTTKAYLPGGYFPHNDLQGFIQHMLTVHARLPQNLILHYVNTYGTRSIELLMNAQSISDLGKHFGGLLYQREVDYLVEQEWALTAEDILWRRGKQGLWFSPIEVQDLEDYLKTSIGHNDKYLYNT